MPPYITPAHTFHRRHGQILLSPPPWDLCLLWEIRKESGEEGGEEGGRLILSIMLCHRKKEGRRKKRRKEGRRQEGDWEEEGRKGRKEEGKRTPSRNIIFSI